MSKDPSSTNVDKELNKRPHHEQINQWLNKLLLSIYYTAGIGDKSTDETIHTFKELIKPYLLKHSDCRLKKPATMVTCRGASRWAPGLSIQPCPLLPDIHPILDSQWLSAFFSFLKVSTTLGHLRSITLFEKCHYPYLLFSPPQLFIVLLIKVLWFSPWHRISAFDPVPCSYQSLPFSSFHSYSKWWSFKVLSLLEIFGFYRKGSINLNKWSFKDGKA